MKTHAVATIITIWTETFMILSFCAKGKDQRQNIFLAKSILTFYQKLDLKDSLTNNNVHLIIIQSEIIIFNVLVKAKVNLVRNNRP